MMDWLRRLFKLDDDTFNPNFPFDQCEAIVARHCGMPVSCGRRTNMREGGYWVCSWHPIAKAKKFA
jgi:hypothetical protein